MAFFLEATFVGLFFFGWDKLSQGRPPGRHLAGGARLQLLGAVDPDRQRLDAEPGRRGASTRTPCAWRSPTSSRCSSTRWRRPSSCTRCRPATSLASIFVLGVQRLVPAAGPAYRTRQALDDGGRVASAWPSALSVVVLGDESGYLADRKPEDEARRDRGDVEDRAGAGRLHRLRLPRPARRARPHYAVHIPWVLGLIGTRSLDHRDSRHRRAGASAPSSASAIGISAYDALQTDPRSRQRGRCRRGAQRLRGARPRPRLCAAAQALRRRSAQGHARADRAGGAATPCRAVAPLFWSFRIMVGLGFFFIAASTATFFVLSARRQLDALPLAAEGGAVRACRCRGSPPSCGWIVAEFGRQPWVIEGVLPTAVAVSNLGVGTVLLTIARLRR